MSLHYLVKDKIRISVTKALILAMSMTWIKLFRLNNKLYAFIHLLIYLLYLLHWGGCYQIRAIRCLIPYIAKERKTWRSHSIDSIHQRFVKIFENVTIRPRTFYWCSIVSMALSRVVSEIFSVEKCRDLVIRDRGHSRSLTVVPFDRLGMVSYYCSMVTLSLFDL